MAYKMEKRAFIKRIFSTLCLVSLLACASMSNVQAVEIEDDDPLINRANGYVPDGFYADPEDAYCVMNPGSASDTEQDDISQIFMNPDRYDKLLWGVDVSTYQGDIDWNKMKSQGIDFAIIRCGYRGYGSAGNMRSDARYKKNIVDAHNAGVKVGVYFFSQAITVNEGIEEAKYLISLIEPYKNMIDLPLVMDYEHVSPYPDDYSRLRDAFRSGALNYTKGTQIVNAFCDYVRGAGYEPMVYANKDDLSNQKVSGSAISQRGDKIWMARWNYNPSNPPATDFKYQFWQYSNKGVGANYGVQSSDLDMDVWYFASPYADSNIYISKDEIDSLGYNKRGADTSYIFYVDGVEYEAACANKSKAFADGVYESDDRLYYTLLQPEGESKSHIVTLYNYDANGIPNGMTCWMVDYDGKKLVNGTSFGAYNEPVMEGTFTNLLSYQGASMRTQDLTGGNNGAIRFHSGIKTDVKNAMIGKGNVSLANGYTLVEYGTITNLASKVTETAPLAVTTSGVLKGRSLYKDGSKYVEMSYNVGSDGITRFRNTLTGILSDSSKAGNVGADFAYRSYAIVQKNGVKYTIYGPVVKKSLKTLAGQVKAAGEFAPGSLEYNYVDGLARWGE